MGDRDRRMVWSSPDGDLRRAREPLRGGAGHHGDLPAAAADQNVAGLRDPVVERVVLEAVAGVDGHVPTGYAQAGMLDEDGEVVLDAGGTYASGEPVRVRVRRRGRRYAIDDDGAAVRCAGAPAGWLEVARRVVEEDSLNVNRRGVVFVPAVEGRDIAGLAERVAGTSRAVHGALLELAG
jgi:hypothetical protein